MTKKALITGSSEGIGHSFAIALAKAGYSITAVARSEDKLKKLISEIGSTHQYIVADLSTESGQNKTAQELSSNHYDLLINNAGVGTVGKFTDVPLEKQIQMMNLNNQGLVKLAYAFLKNSKSGDALINVSSTLAFLPMPGLGLYCATKAFVTSFSESLWYEQKARGVYVMGLCPGITSTNFQTNSGGKSEDLPAGMAQTPEQVVEVALKALLARKSPTVISGAKNFLMSSMTRLMPRKSAVSMMGKMMSQ